jgi:hypothetical protein
VDPAHKIGGRRFGQFVGPSLAVDLRLHTNVCGGFELKVPSSRVGVLWPIYVDM